jgi:RimJ/RimL family protein N-acetyltransferase
MKNADFSKLEITTKRLRLVPSTQEFASVTFKEFTKEIAEYMQPKPYESLEETKKALNDRFQRMQSGIDISLTLLNKKNNEFLGRVSLLDVNTQTPEIGIWIKKSAHGNGYGKEAVDALMGWINRNLDFKYLRYPVDRRNSSSIRIANSLGGIAGKEYPKKNMAGKMLDIVEYWIYRE